MIKPIPFKMKNPWKIFFTKGLGLTAIIPTLLFFYFLFFKEILSFPELIGATYLLGLCVFYGYCISQKKNIFENYTDLFYTRSFINKELNFIRKNLESESKNYVSREDWEKILYYLNGLYKESGKYGILKVSILIQTAINKLVIYKKNIFQWASLFDILDVLQEELNEYLEIEINELLEKLKHVIER